MFNFVKTKGGRFPYGIYQLILQENVRITYSYQMSTIRSTGRKATPNRLVKN